MTDIKRPEWKEIESAKVSDGVRVLLFFPRESGGRIDIGYWDDGKDQWRALSIELVQGRRFMSNNQPTHWMPLPQPPEDNREG